MSQAKSSLSSDVSPIALTNLSPDSFYGSYADPQNITGSPYDHRYYIYKANDTLIVGGLNGEALLGAYIDTIPTGNNVLIQATNLIIATSLTIPRADIQIYCRHLTIPAGVSVTIDVSAAGDDDTDKMMVSAAVKQAAEGQPGQNGATVAKAWAQDILNAGDTPPPADPDYGAPINYQFGQNGEDGGSITIICDELQLDGTLILNANGRNGYTGCPGQPGGSAAAGQTAAQGGDAQAGGWGGNGGAVSIQYRTLTSGDLNTALQMNANPGNAGMAGAAGPGGSPNGANGNSAPGSTAGIGGSTSNSTFTGASVLGQAFDEIYLLKAVETAKLQYMLNEPTAFSANPADTTYKPVQDLLVWLQSVLSGYATLGNNPGDSDYRKNNLYLITSTYCTRISYTPPLTSAGNLASSIPGWTIYNLTDQNILQQIEEKYLSDGTQSLSNLQTTYTDYMNAFATVMKAENTAEAIVAQYQTYVNSAASYKLTCDALLAMLDPSVSSSIAGQLSQASTTLLNAFNTLSPILTTVQTTIANHYDCNAQNVLSTLSQAVPQMLFMAAEPEMMLPMAAASMSPLILDGINQITDNSGKAIDKSQVMTDLKAITSNGADFINDVKGDLLNPDGSLKSSASYVLSQLSTLTDDISNLSSSIDADNNNQDIAEQAVAAIESLKQAIINKSQLQLQYQTYAAAAATAWQNYQDAQKRADAIKATDPSKMPTPDLLGHVSYLAMLYQKGLTDYIAFESQFKRFAAWLSLDNTDDPDLTQTATTLTSYWSVGTPPSETDLDNVHQNLLDYEDKLSNYFLNQSSPANPTPANPLTQRPSDLVISITADCMLDLLRKGVSQSVAGKDGYQLGAPITFIIVPFGVAKQWGIRHDRSYPPITNKDGSITYFYRNDKLGLVGIPMVEFSQSGEFYDLRANYVQPRIIGAKYTGNTYTGTTMPLPNTNDPKPQSISISIHAPATRWFWSSSDSSNETTNHLIFTHPNGRDAIFEHYYLTTPDGTAYDVSGNAGELSDPTLAPIGIYGPWSIRLSSWTTNSDPNAQIDFSTVTEIHLGFAGTARVISGLAAHE